MLQINLKKYDNDFRKYTILFSKINIVFFLYRFSIMISNIIFDVFSKIFAASIENCYLSKISTLQQKKVNKNRSHVTIENTFQTKNQMKS